MNNSNILISNQFSSKYHPEAGKGHDPKKFLTDYAARPDATEPLALHGDMYNDFNSHSLGHELQSNSPRDLSKYMQRCYGLSGRTFGDTSYSYTNKELKERSDRLKHLYDQGHSVGMYVISFSVPYLKSKHVMDPNFTMDERGSAFGYTDQLKLRQAINNGFRTYTRNAKFKNPMWTGTLQFDTGSVHCHALLVDDCPLNQSQRLVKHQKSHFHRYHLEDRGKILKHDRDVMKHGIDFSLSRTKPMTVMDAEPEAIHSNFTTRVQHMVGNQIGTSNRLQKLIASLPKDKSKWRYPSRDKIMRHPNRLLSEYMKSLVQNDDDKVGYGRTLGSLRDASFKYQSPSHPYDELYRNGYRKLDNQMANTIYGLLRKSSSSQFTVRTPYMKSSSYSMDEARSMIGNAYRGEKVPNVNMLMFNYRTNSFQIRYQGHYRQREMFRKDLRVFDKAEMRGQINPLAEEMRPYYRDEKRYHSASAEKYRYLLGFRKPFCNEQDLRSMEHRREGLSRRYTSLQEGKRDYKYPWTDKMLADPRLHQVLQVRDENGGSFSDTIYRLIQDPYMKPSKGTVARMNVLSSPNRFPEYRSSLDEIQGNHRQAISRAYPYLMDLNDFCDDSFDDGLVNSSHLMDVRKASVSGDIPRPPRMVTDHDPDEDDFEAVKGVDLQDCTYDISPGESHHVSHRTEHEFDESIDSRTQGMSGAVDYLTRSNQAVDEADRLEQVMKNLRKMKRRVDRRHELPINNDIGDFSEEIGERNQVTFTAQDAQKYSNESLTELNNTNQQFSESLQTNPTDVLYESGPTIDASPDVDSGPQL